MIAPAELAELAAVAELARTGRADRTGRTDRIEPAPDGQRDRRRFVCRPGPSFLLQAGRYLAAAEALMAGPLQRHRRPGRSGTEPPGRRGREARTRRLGDRCRMAGGRAKPAGRRWRTAGDRCPGAQVSGIRL